MESTDGLGDLWEEGEDNGVDGGPGVTEVVVGVRGDSPGGLLGGDLGGGSASTTVETEQYGEKMSHIWKIHKEKLRVNRAGGYIFTLAGKSSPPSPAQ